MEERNKEISCSLATRLVHNALQIAEKMDCPVYLILDAFFAKRPCVLGSQRLRYSQQGCPGSSYHPGQEEYCGLS